ncbi:hypothetical protein BH18VER1_BH18VER1_13170 [soil metagenome]
MGESILIKRAIPEKALVAVIASLSDLQHAIRLRRLPTFFELRLDALHGETDLALDQVRRLRAPIIITARTAAEGGVNRLSASKRCDLLLSFIDEAAFLDVELRSLAGLRPVFDAATGLRVGRILSVHDLQRTPPREELEQFACDARAERADIFKIATRVNTRADASRLHEFFVANRKSIPLSAMCFGKDSRALRLRFAREGSALNYTYLRTPLAEGQWSLGDMRRALERKR